MEILFRKYIKGEMTFISRVIHLFTRGSTHVEIRPKDRPCISSSEQDGGVRWANWITGDPKKWDIYRVKGFSQQDEEKVIAWCETQVGKKYDWRGIVQYIFPHIRNKTGDMHKWYCSEFCQRAIALVHWELLDYVVKNPEALRKLLLKLDLIEPINQAA